MPFSSDFSMIALSYCSLVALKFSDRILTSLSVIGSTIADSCVTTEFPGNRERDGLDPPEIALIISEALAAFEEFKM